MCSRIEHTQYKKKKKSASAKKGISVYFFFFFLRDSYIKQNGKEIGFERVIRYNDGITLDQVMASGCFPVNFDYALLEVESYYHHHDDDNNNDSRTRSDNQDRRSGDSTSTNSHPSPDRDFSRQYRKEIRHFWDGGLLTNTPLTQLVILHRDYWYKIRGLKDKVPTLGVGVINVHPTRQTEIPTDHDGVVNRNNVSLSLIGVIEMKRCYCWYLII